MCLTLNYNKYQHSTHKWINNVRLSDSTKQKIAIARTGTTRSPETIAKIKATKQQSREIRQLAIFQAYLLLTMIQTF